MINPIKLICIKNYISVPYNKCYSLKKDNIYYVEQRDIIYFYLENYRNLFNIYYTDENGNFKSAGVINKKYLVPLQKFREDRLNSILND
jgi:hypothetical protein